MALGKRGVFFSPATESFGKTVAQEFTDNWSLFLVQKANTFFVNLF